MNKTFPIPYVSKSATHQNTDFDTAEVYGPFPSETLVGKAFVGMQDKLVLAKKFGFNLKEDGSPGWQGVTSHLDRNKKAVKGSLKRL